MCERILLGDDVDAGRPRKKRKRKKKKSRLKDGRAAAATRKPVSKKTKNI